MVGEFVGGNMAEFSELVQSMDAETLMSWIGSRGLDQVVEEHIYEDYNSQSEEGKKELYNELEALIKHNVQRNGAIQRAQAKVVYGEIEAIKKKFRDE